MATFTSEHPLLKRTPGDIARRVACTQMVLTRWGIEAALTSSQGKGPVDPRIEQSYGALAKAIEESKLSRSFTSVEQELIDKPLGQWSPVDDLASQSMRWESFGTLLWAIKILNSLPKFHVRFSQELLFQSTAIVPAFPTTITSFLQYFDSGEGSKPSHIVTPDELRSAVNTAEAWYWRARAQIVLDLKESLEGDSEDIKAARKKIPSGLKTIMANLDQALSQASIRASADGYIDEIVGEDFGVDGVAYRKLDDHGIRDMSDISEYRLAALSWLCGRDWEFKRGEVPFIHPLGSLWAPEE
ncbi:hypothetical protein PhCBS80983_g06159 [Powellomyces hirtus]|uniref:Uncharacterized protein n=1 Tax=Powellomyces hirtus TaxID=109895 RepID=A0A507DPW5_9FUNG|nr:hypothetical protein PhCBS80983_g06159 [Powellomyces hirtus]